MKKLEKFNTIELSIDEMRKTSGGGLWTGVGGLWNSTVTAVAALEFTAGVMYGMLISTYENIPEAFE